jgi:hypothetical protein
MFPVSYLAYTYSAMLTLYRLSDGLVATSKVVDMVRSRVSTAWAPTTYSRLTPLLLRATT